MKFLDAPHQERKILQPLTLISDLYIHITALKNLKLHVCVQDKTTDILFHKTLDF